MPDDAWMKPARAPNQRLAQRSAQRLREIYRSAGWPYLDALEVELLAAGLLQQVHDAGGHVRVQVTPLGIAHLADCIEHNRASRSAHEQLVDRLALAMVREGRLVWTGLKLRAQLPPEEGGKEGGKEGGRWKICRPDVFSIRHTTVPDYLEPIVHEIKVSRADLLCDLKRKDKRESYLDVGGQCWYVLGCDSHGRSIGTADDVPAECGVLIAEPDRWQVARQAPKRPAQALPFALWMALAKATPREATPPQTGLLEDGHGLKDWLPPP